MAHKLRHWISLVETHSVSEAVDLYAPSTWEIVVPSIFYRAATTAMSSSYLTRMWRHPDPALPDAINHLLSDDQIERVSGLSSNTPFKISRTYSGMSNWGFGVYFASDLNWATRYGDCITAVTVDASTILAIRADDFAQRLAGTSGGELQRRLTAKAGERMSDQASVMGAVVRGLKRGARALYVATEADRGQLCVFSAQAIYPRFYFEMKSSASR
jgi:hypothetical protein